MFCVSRIWLSLRDRVEIIYFAIINVNWLVNRKHYGFTNHKGTYKGFHLLQDTLQSEKKKNKIRVVVLTLRLLYTG